jgi:hypothetical protein
LVAAGYWTLSVAAGRGNPLAMSIAIAFISMQGVLYLISYKLHASNRTVTTPLFAIVIVLVVDYSLARSRSVLLKLKERGLWDDLFGDARPSRRLCVTGAVLLTVGVAGSNLAGDYMRIEMSREMYGETGRAQAFLTMLKVDETEFARALVKAKQRTTSEAVANARSKLKALREKAEGLGSDLGRRSRMNDVLTHYRVAISHWEQALDSLDQPEPDTEASQEHLRQADKSRAKAGDSFNESYAGKPE